MPDRLSYVEFDRNVSYPGARGTACQSFLSAEHGFELERRGDWIVARKGGHAMEYPRERVVRVVTAAEAWEERATAPFEEATPPPEAPRRRRRRASPALPTE